MNSLDFSPHSLSVFWSCLFVSLNYSQERRGFKLLSFKIRHLFPNLKVIWVDGGYDGQPLQLWVKRWFNWVVETIKRNQDTKGFEVLPKRWVVERTFGLQGIVV